MAHSVAPSTENGLYISRAAMDGKSAELHASSNTCCAASTFFEAPGIAQSHAAPSLLVVRSAVLANLCGIGMALQTCSHFLQPQVLWLVGGALLAWNVHHQHRQTQLVNQLLARHVTRMSWTASRHLWVECEQVPLGTLPVKTLCRLWECGSGMPGPTVAAIASKRVLHLDTLGGRVHSRAALAAAWRFVVSVETRHFAGEPSAVPMPDKPAPASPAAPAAPAESASTFSAPASGVIVSPGTVRCHTHFVRPAPRFAISRSLSALPMQPLPKMAIHDVGQRSFMASAFWNLGALFALVVSTSITSADAASWLHG